MKNILKIGQPQKEISIELLRIYACMLVIFAHIQISYLSGETVNKAAFIIKCLIGDNVPIFLLILGFYMFTGLQGEDRIGKIPGAFLRKLKGFLIRIYIPTLIVTLIACFAGTFIYCQESFADLFTSPSFNWDYLKNYVLYQDPQDMVGQFWYIVVYIKILAFFPALALICVDQKEYNLIRRIYMALSFLNIVIDDIEFLKSTTYFTIEKYVFDRHFLYVLLGYELALLFKKWKWDKKLQIAVSAGVFLLGLGLRYGLTMHAFSVFGMGATDHFMVLECAPAYISSAGTLMLFHAVFQKKYNSVVEFVGGMTFYVYMLHGMMLRYFGEIGNNIRVATNYGASGPEAIRYYLQYGIVLFLTSFLFGVIIKLIYDLICKGIQKIFTKS